MGIINMEPPYYAQIWEYPPPCAATGLLHLLAHIFQEIVCFAAKCLLFSHDRHVTYIWHINLLRTSSKPKQHSFEFQCAWCSRFMIGMRGRCYCLAQLIFYWRTNSPGLEWEKIIPWANISIIWCHTGQCMEISFLVVWD